MCKAKRNIQYNDCGRFYFRFMTGFNLNLPEQKSY